MCSALYSRYVILTFNSENSLWNKRGSGSRNVAAGQEIWKLGDQFSRSLAKLFWNGFITAHKRSCGKVMLLQLSVILFTGGARGFASVHTGIPPPGSGTPQSRQPPTRHSPDQAPPEQTPPGPAIPREQTPPCTVHAGRYGQQAGSMHPTGMQSCLFNRNGFKRNLVISVQFNDILYEINDINNDIEQLCHKPDGLLVFDKGSGWWGKFPCWHNYFCSWLWRDYEGVMFSLTDSVNNLISDVDRLRCKCVEYARVLHGWPFSRQNKCKTIWTATIGSGVSCLSCDID